MALAPSALVKVTVVPDDPTKTPAVMVSPPTVSTGPDVTSLDSTLAAITWRRRTLVRASLSARRASRASLSILAKAALLGARTVNGPAAIYKIYFLLQTFVVHFHQHLSNDCSKCIFVCLFTRKRPKPESEPTISLLL